MRYPSHTYLPKFNFHLLAWWLHTVQIETPLRILQMQTPHYSIKQTSFLVPLVALTQSRLSGWLIHQLDTIIALVYIALAFLSSIQQERALKHAFIVLNGMSTHCHAYWKYRGSTVAPSIHLSKIFWSHFPGSFWGEIATEKQKEVIESLWGGREGFEINTKITHS